MASKKQTYIGPNYKKGILYKRTWYYPRKWTAKQQTDHIKSDPYWSKYFAQEEPDDSVKSTDKNKN